jgi:hypothetical protein
MAAARGVTHLGPPSSWLNRQELDEYLMTWRDLQSFYERSEDEVVGPEIISYFAILVDNLYHMACEIDRDPQVRFLADHRLNELLTAVQGAMGEAYNNYYHNRHGDKNI